MSSSTHPLRVEEHNRDSVPNLPSRKTSMANALYSQSKASRDSSLNVIPSKWKVSCVDRGENLSL